MSVGLSISPGNMSVYDTNNRLKFSTERIYPVVLWHGNFHWGETGTYMPIAKVYGTSTVYAHGGLYNITNHVILRRGTHYQGHPEFVTANVVGSSSVLNISNTITGSYIAASVTGPSRGARLFATQAGQEEWMRVGPICLLVYHLWVNGNGDVILSYESALSDYVTTGHPYRNKIYHATNLMRNQTVPAWSISSREEMRAMLCSFPRIDITVGRFTG